MSKATMTPTGLAQVAPFGYDSANMSYTDNRVTLNTMYFYGNESSAHKDHSGNIRGYAWFKNVSYLRTTNVSSIKLKGDVILPAPYFNVGEGYSTNDYWGGFSLTLADVDRDASKEITYNKRNSVQTATEIAYLIELENLESMKTAFEVDLMPYLNQIINAAHLRCDFSCSYDRDSKASHEGADVKNIRLEIEYEAIKPTLVQTYPVGVNIDVNRFPVMTWNFDAVRADGTILPQYMYAIHLTIDSPTVGYISLYFQKTTSDQFCDLATEEPERYQTSWRQYWTAGSKVEWWIEASAGGGLADIDVIYAATGLEEFNIIGETEAPVITDVTMESRPTITWTCDNQVGYDLKIKNTINGNTVYETGLVQSTARELKVTKMISEGDYTVEIRALNSYGTYTDWSSYHWVLVFQDTPTIPETPVVTVVSGYIVDITTYDALTDSSDQYWVVRVDEDGNEEVISVHNNNHSIDSRCSLNKTYYYKLRHQNIESSGYADSDAVLAYISAKGVVINTEDQAFHLWKNSDNKPFAISKSNKVEKVLHRVIGRKYPIKETSNWITVTRAVKAYVTSDEFEKLLQISENGESVFYRADNESFMADMDVDYDSMYIDGGYIVNFTFTRLNEDAVNLEE